MAKTQTITWHNEDTASQALIEPLLDDMGVKSPPLRAAVRGYCNKLLNEAQFTMGDINIAAACFYEGIQCRL